MDGPTIWYHKTTVNYLKYLATNPRGTQALDKNIVVTFLYYTRYLNCDILPSLNSISDQQEHPTKNTKAEINHIMDYAATNPDAVIKF